MSRIGNLPIHLPKGVSVAIKDNVVTVKGPKGELSQKIDNQIKIEEKEGVLHFTRSNDDREQRALHGLYRALVNNMVKGVSEGYKKALELVGVGFRASSEGQVLNLSLGYTHAIYLQLPPEIKVKTISERNQNPLVLLESCDKQLIGQVCAKLRSLRSPEPYKGKGVKFQGEVIRKKAGKTAAK